MSRKGLLINYDYCSGCKTCEAACRQEHEFLPDVYGIKVEEVLLNQGQTYYNIPIPTNMCDLCKHRTDEGKKPACVHHCMMKVMKYGPVEELVKEMEEKPYFSLWTPHPKSPISPVTGKSICKEGCEQCFICEGRDE